jgi:oligosaccharyltransferase complex subunit epsilon
MKRKAKTAEHSIEAKSSQVKNSIEATVKDSKVKDAEIQKDTLLSQLLQSYRLHTEWRLRVIDVYLVFLILTGIVQAIYMQLSGKYPLNAFLSSFIASVGSFVLTGLMANIANLRIQINRANNFKISTQRAFAEFCFANFVLFAFAINFVG